MHVGFLTPEYPHITDIYGGIATSVRTLAGSLTEQGHEATVFLYGRDRNETTFDGKIRIVHIARKRHRYIGWWSNRKNIESIVNEEIRRRNIDLVEAPDWTGITAFMNLESPVVVRIHGSDTYFCHLEKRKQKYKNYFLEKKAIHMADHIVSVSRFAAEETKKLFFIDRNIEIIYNGVEIKNSSTEQCGAQGFRKNSLFYFGTLMRKKGVLELPRIFNEVVSRCPDATLWIAGADSADIVSASPSTWELMQPLFSTRAYARVRYLGKIPHNEIRKRIFESEVCVFPSFAEAFPISWLEAMACGKAIVASDIGWATECIEDGKSGFLVSPSNHGEYADKIVKILEDPSLSLRLGTEAAKRVRSEFDIDKIVQDNLKYYEKIVSRNNKP